MTKRKIVRPVTKKYDRLKYYLLSLLQALLGSLILVCIFIYRISSTLQVGDSFSQESFVPDFAELRGDYYESPIYTTNLTSLSGNVLRYLVIREQMETDGIYNPDKLINIGAFANRNSGDIYAGPEATYRLDDLLKWGRTSVSHEALVFFSWEEYNEFFNNSNSEVPANEEGQIYEKSSAEYPGLVEDTEGDKKVVAYLDTVINKYLTNDGLKLEENVDNSEDYYELVSYLEKTITDLKSNYDEYIIYKEYFDNGFSNVKYYASLPYPKYVNIYTNTEEISKASSDSFVTDTMKKFGEFVRITPGEVGFLTNTPIQYQAIEPDINNKYAYAFPKGSTIWISIDTNYPYDDYLKSNYNSYRNGSRMIPWVVSFGILSVIGFLAIMVYLILSIRKNYGFEGGKDLLKEFDKLPFELTALFFILLISVLIIGESIILRNINTTFEMSVNIIPIAALLGIDLYVILVFFYGFVRRVICGNLFEGSLIAHLFPVFSVISNKMKIISQDIYDDSGLIIKVFFGYIVFLVVNLFLVLDIILGNRGILAVIILVLFDVIIGIIIYRRNVERREIIEGIKRINAGEYDFHFDRNKMHGINRSLSDEINNTGLGISKAVETSIKDEKLKADLITNVSHDIKTPLTSIINYVDLLKKEKIENENAEKYLMIIGDKAERLRQLTFDLVEASKISSGNIVLDIVKIDFVELLAQTIGEFEDKFNERGLNVVMNIPNTPVLVDADPRRMWRIIENLFNNIYKYALENTRVYVDLIVVNDNDHDTMCLSIKNVSKNELNIPAEELTERFIRGDVSRSTEGSGLGLSIAKSLTTVQGGTFDIYLDGDLFKVTLTFNVASNE